jgi:hypothetical protein
MFKCHATNQVDPRKSRNIGCSLSAIINANTNVAESNYFCLYFFQIMEIILQQKNTILATRRRSSFSLSFIETQEEVEEALKILKLSEPSATSNKKKKKIFFFTRCHYRARVHKLLYTDVVVTSPSTITAKFVDANHIAEFADANHAIDFVDANHSIASRHCGYCVAICHRYEVCDANRSAALCHCGRYVVVRHCCKAHGRSVALWLSRCRLPSLQNLRTWTALQHRVRHVTICYGHYVVVHRLFHHRQSIDVHPRTFVHQRLSTDTFF